MPTNTLIFFWNSELLLILWTSYVKDVLILSFPRCFQCLHLIVSFGCVSVLTFLSPVSFWPCILLFGLCIPPNATAYKMIEKCFEQNAYLCVQRRAEAVNKLNMQIILFSSSVSNKVYLSKTQLHQIIITQSALWNLPCWLTTAVCVAVHRYTHTHKFT